jgi:hypothetical protein
MGSCGSFLTGNQTQLRRSAIGLLTLAPLLLWIVCAPSVLGQAASGTLRGQVSDPSGAVVAGASVSATPTAGPTRTVQTSGQGIYEFNGLLPGRYTVSAVAKGFTDNTGKTSQIAKDGLTLARRFRDHEDMILRFAVDPAVGFTSNQAERDVRPVKVQQRNLLAARRQIAGNVGRQRGLAAPPFRIGNQDGFHRISPCGIQAGLFFHL